MTQPLSEAELDLAERLIQRRIDHELPVLQRRLNRLEPLEVIAILGHLTTEAFKRVEPEHRMSTWAAWTETLTESVRDTLG